MTTTTIERRQIGEQSVLTGGPTDAPAIILLHGIGSSAEAMRAQIDEFAQDLRVLAPDAPGYAESADPPSAPGIDGYVDTAAALLDAERLDNVMMLGVSWGGVVATAFALRYPDRVHALVLADTSRGSGRDADRATAMRRRGDELTRLGAKDFAALRAPRLLSPAAPRELVHSVAANMAAAIRMPGYAYAAASMADTDHTELIGQLRVPTLILVGEADTVCPPSEARAIADAIPGSRLAVIPHAGHLANQEQPASFNAAVRAFLAEHRPLPTRHVHDQERESNRVQ